MNAAQILEQIPAATSCTDSDAVDFAQWKIYKLASESFINVADSPELMKRLIALDKQMKKVKK